MKVIGQDNREYNFPKSGYKADFNDTRSKSSLHIEARELLRQTFPTFQIWEECNLPGSPLHFDFVIPQARMCVEVQGEQHYSYNSFFYKDKFAFARAQNNDKIKKEFCEINNIDFVELKYNEVDKWESQIKDI